MRIYYPVIVHASQHVDTVSQAPDGFSVYRGILIVSNHRDWFDTRVLDVIDDMDPDLRASLVSISAYKGMVSLVWRDLVPAAYREEENLRVPDGDEWFITSSSVACSWPGSEDRLKERT